MVHLATVVAVMPATPGRSLQCCSQQSDRERSGWADRADMKSDWCTLSEEIAGNKNGRRDTRQQDVNISPHPVLQGSGRASSRGGSRAGSRRSHGSRYQELVAVP